jgi:outer membrane protein assembly factor BamB
MKKLTLLTIIILLAATTFAQVPILNWAKTYHGNEYSVDSSSVMKINENDKSIYIGTTSDAFGTANDILLIKRDFVTGDTIWTRRYNGPANGDDQFVDMVINQSTGEIYVTGKSMGIGTGYDFITIKYFGIGG